MAETDDIVKDFLVESAENLDRLDREFVELERAPGSRDLLASIFRTIHTIKGTCGFFGFAKLEKLAHAAESLLAQLRDGKREMNQACAEALLESVDAIRAMLACIETNGSDGDEAYPALVARLKALTAGEDLAAAPAPVAPEAPPVVVAPPVAEAPAPAAPSAPSVAPPVVVPEPAPSPSPAMSAPSAAPEGRGAADSTVRLDIAVLDQLMTLVGELVLARNQALQVVRNTEGAAAVAWQRIDNVTGSLQEAVMRTRMLPLGNLFNRYPRIVRDLATLCGKQVRLEIEGADTGLDRTLLEAIKDPLTHIVRNAIDHGFESPEARVAAGKPAEGRLLLRACHEGGRVTIEVADDGGGINVDKVRRRAVERGLISAQRAETMTDREAQDILFMPGFSTADQVTNLSGRGVGMDVVRTNIASIGGSVEVESAMGAGTSLKMRVPLTLAIIPAMIVHGGGERFAMPQVSVQEIIRLGANGPALENVHDVPVLRLRDRLIPILRLDDELGLPRQAVPDPCVVVLAVGATPFGLLVDYVADRMDIVVKPVPRRIANRGTFAGATVLGDGAVSLILDAAGLAERARIQASASTRAAVRDADREAENRDADTWVLFRGPDDARIIIPLSRVTRIEEVPLDRIERDPDGDVLQYRSEIMPIIRLATMLVERRRHPRNPQVVAADAGLATGHVIVHSGPRGSVGILVTEVLDILEARIVAHRPAVRPGVKFSTILRDRVTEVLDLDVIVRRRIPDFYDPPATKEAA